jgi:hypothetical protein
MQTLRGNTGGKRFAILGTARGTGTARVTPWVAPELGGAGADEAPAADELFARTFALTRDGEASLVAVAAAVERGQARDVPITPEAVAAA